VVHVSHLTACILYTQTLYLVEKQLKQALEAYHPTSVRFSTGGSSRTNSAFVDFASVADAQAVRRAHLVVDSASVTTEFARVRGAEPQSALRSATSSRDVRWICNKVSSCLASTCLCLCSTQLQLVACAVTTASLSNIAHHNLHLHDVQAFRSATLVNAYFVPSLFLLAAASRVTV
jgi:hypothetical protein